MCEKPELNLSSLAHINQPGMSGEELDGLAQYNIAQGPPEKSRLMRMTKLDEMQLCSVWSILTDELAIVQGPPGTGKTFTTLEAIKILVNTREAKAAPILVAAQTNHALDQLLKICQASGARILRIGGRSDSEELVQRTPHELFKSHRKSSGPPGLVQNRKEFARLREWEWQGNIEQVRAVVGENFGDRPLDPRALAEAGLITQQQYASLAQRPGMPAGEHPGDDFRAWLGPDLIPATLSRAPRTQREMGADVPDEHDVLHHQQHDESMKDTMEEDDVDDHIRIAGAFVPLQNKWTGKEPSGWSDWGPRAEKELRDRADLYKIGQHFRGAVYRLLQSKMLAVKAERFRALLADNVRICKRLKENKWRGWVKSVLHEDIDIVGCTTTGLSKYRGFLAGLQPTTVVIEEAAETREANITAALYPSVQQLALIGDHQQLAPQTPFPWLAEAPFRITLSLFERMIESRVPFVRLDVQRRMAPELRQFLDPFYPDLQDDAVACGVQQRPLVPGMGHRRCWFFDHSWPEHTDEEHSKINDEEAQMVAKFYAYLFRNGLSVQEITVLTFYNGQRKRLARDIHRELPELGRAHKAKVCTVDAYQGEENEVVLLSMVRSAQPGQLGFLNDVRRVIVAISRAKRGFFIFGNADNALYPGPQRRTNHLWASVWNVFAHGKLVKRELGLPLVCQVHENETWVKSVEDWDCNAGGCDQPCGRVRSCGHACTLNCHMYGDPSRRQPPAASRGRPKHVLTGQAGRIMTACHAASPAPRNWPAVMVARGSATRRISAVARPSKPSSPFRPSLYRTPRGLGPSSASADPVVPCRLTSVRAGQLSGMRPKIRSTTL